MDFEKLNLLPVISDSRDIYTNLAAESLLCEKCGDTIGYIFLWVNSDSVVIGSNQNAFSECDVNLLKADGVKIARRRTGGGAVWHDMGNLNFSFIVPDKYYDEKRQLEIVSGILKSHGINAVPSGRNDLECEGYKVSGSAFYHGKKTGLHHGTLLVNSDILKMQKYLKPGPEKLRHKGVASVRARVKNLSGFKEGLTVGTLISDFCERFGKSGTFKPGDFMGSGELKKRTREFSDEEYILNKHGAKGYNNGAAFDWGICRVCYNLDKDGNIKDMTVSSDSLYFGLKEFCEDYFNGKNIKELDSLCFPPGILRDENTEVGEDDTEKEAVYTNRKKIIRDVAEIIKSGAEK